MLDLGAEACRQRDAARHPDEQFAFDGHDELTATMRDGYGTLGWWLDTSALPPEETAERVVVHAYARGGVPAGRPSRALTEPDGP